jgi:hypothetical protein
MPLFPTGGFFALCAPPPPSKKISFTGHRNINENTFRPAVADTLSKIKAKYPDALVNVGGALGTDMVAGEEALKAGLDIVMVMPFAFDNENQRWAAVYEVNC